MDVGDVVVRHLHDGKGHGLTVAHYTEHDVFGAEPSGFGGGNERRVIKHRKPRSRPTIR